VDAFLDDVIVEASSPCLTCARPISPVLRGRNLGGAGTFGLVFLLREILLVNVVLGAGVVADLGEEAVKVFGIAFEEEVVADLRPVYFLVSPLRDDVR